MHESQAFSYQVASFMERRSGWFILAILAITALLAIPMVVLAPDEQASGNPGGAVYDLVCYTPHGGPGGAGTGHRRGRLDLRPSGVKRGDVPLRWGVSTIWPTALARANFTDLCADTAAKGTHR